MTVSSTLLRLTQQPNIQVCTPSPSFPPLAWNQTLRYSTHFVMIPAYAHRRDLGLDDFQKLKFSRCGRHGKVSAFLLFSPISLLPCPSPAFGCLPSFVASSLPSLVSHHFLTHPSPTDVVLLLSVSLLVSYILRAIYNLFFSAQSHPGRGLRLLAHNTRTPPRAMQDYPETLRNLGPRSPRRTQQNRLPRSLHYARRILLAQVQQELLLYKPPHVRSFSICLVLYLLLTQNDG